MQRKSSILCDHRDAGHKLKEIIIPAAPDLLSAKAEV